MPNFEEILPLADRMKKLYTKTCRTVCKRYGFSQTEFDILGFLGDKNGLDTAIEIAKNRPIKKANISTSVERLTKEGYLKRRTDSKDRRLIHLELTEKAAEPLAEIKESQEKFFSLFFSGISKEEIKTYKNITKKLILGMEEKLKINDEGSVL